MFSRNIAPKLPIHIHFQTIQNHKKFKISRCQIFTTFSKGSKIDDKVEILHRISSGDTKFWTQGRCISNSQVHKTALNISGSFSLQQSFSLNPYVSLPRRVPLLSQSLQDKIVHVDLTIPQTEACTAQTILRAIHYFGSTAFAYNGSTIAGHAGMHILGCIIIGTINAIGGGTIRDILTGNVPIFWMRQPQFIYIGLIASGITFILWPYLEEKEMNLEKDSLPIIICDACGVASISIVGAQNALQLGLHPAVCVMLGMISSSFGGLVRDVLCDLKPRILYNHAHVYATTALCGSGTYVALKYVGFNPKARIAIAFCASMLSRYLAWKFNFTLLHWDWVKAKNERSSQHLDLILP